MRLTEAEIELLQHGFKGPRPGSNAWPYVEIECDAGIVDGARCADLIRHGLFAPRDARSIVVLTPTPDSETDFDIDCTHNYDATDLGRRALTANTGAPDA